MFTDKEITECRLHNFCGVSIRQRVSDGYLNATEMCKAGGKEWKHYKQNKRTKDFLNVLQRTVRLSDESLNIKPSKIIVESIVVGLNENRGTWVHPRVATHLASWISPEFQVHITEWIEEWRKLQGNEERCIQQLCSLEPSPADQEEKKIQLSLAALYGGEMEVMTPEGRIDILTSDWVIEVKEARGWKAALGQILVYGDSYAGRGLKIILFGKLSTPLEKMRRICGTHGVEVEVYEG